MCGVECRLRSRLQACRGTILRQPRIELVVGECDLAHGLVASLFQRVLGRVALGLRQADTVA